MSSNLFLTMACALSDRTYPIKAGLIKPEGIDLNFINLPSDEVFQRMLMYEEFDISEMSLSNLLIELSRGRDSFKAIPVFTSRTFRHRSIFIRKGSGIKRPEDLKGKRIGVPEYHMTAAVCIRGFLEEEYGVSPKAINWVIGGLEDPGRKDRLHINLPKEIKVEHTKELSLNDMLERDQVDGIITARAPSGFIKGSAKFERLFPNYREEELNYFKKTGIFPIMHTVVIHNRIYSKHPWTAQSLYKSFLSAKKFSYEHSLGEGSLATIHPWFRDEILLLEREFNGDHWPYGIEANRKSLEAAVRWGRNQGLIQKDINIEDVFVTSTGNAFRP